MTRASQRVAREIADFLDQVKGLAKEGGYDFDDERIRPTFVGHMQRWLILLAPPRKSVRRASPRTAKRRATVKELDALCREVVFKRDGGMCRKCGMPAVDWSHCYTRRIMSVRHDLDNSWASCKGCHLKWHQRPLEGAAWWREQLGTARSQALTLRAAKPRKTDPELVRAYLEAERKKL